MAQRNEVCLADRIDIGEDGFSEQSRRVWVDEVSALLVNHDEIGVGERLLSIDDLRQAQ